MTIKKPLVEYAYEYALTKPQGFTFNEIWNAVVEATEMTAAEAGKKVASFYTNLMLDGRFKCLEDKIWNLRENLDFKSSYIDVSEFDSDTESDAGDNEDEEEAQYNATLDYDNKDSDADDSEEGEDKEESEN